jgi:hypothetical protein
MGELNTLSFGLRGAGGSAPPTPVPTLATVPIVVGGSINTGWGIKEVLLMGMGINSTMKIGGAGGSTYNSTLNDDFRYYFMNTSAKFSGILTFDLQLTLTGTILADACQFALGISKATDGNKVNTFGYTLGSDTLLLPVNADEAAYLKGTVPYTAGADDILLFGLYNPSASRAVTNSTVHISGVVTLNSTLS